MSVFHRGTSLVHISHANKNKHVRSKRGFTPVDGASTWYLFKNFKKSEKLHWKGSNFCENPVTEIDLKAEVHLGAPSKVSPCKSSKNYFNKAFLSRRSVFCPEYVLIESLSRTESSNMQIKSRKWTTHIGDRMVKLVFLCSGWKTSHFILGKGKSHLGNKHIMILCSNL